MNTSLLIFLDKDIELLLQEKRLFEEQLQRLTNEKAELERTIYEFGVRYNRELGELIIEILKWRKDNAIGTTFQQETENEYNSFFHNYSLNKMKKHFVLNDLEMQELKVKYRKASKICHPDIAKNNQKERAHKVFAELSCAYELNDLEKVKEILEALEKGEVFIDKNESKNKKHYLQLQLKQIRLRISEFEIEIKKLVSSDTYSKIMSLENLDEYFEKTKQRLQHQLNKLKNG